MCVLLWEMRLNDILLFLGMWNKSNTPQYEWEGIVFPSHEFSKNVYLQSQSLEITGDLLLQWFLHSDGL